MEERVPQGKHQGCASEQHPGQGIAPPFPDGGRDQRRTDRAGVDGVDVVALPGRRDGELSPEAIAEQRPEHARHEQLRDPCRVQRPLLAHAPRQPDAPRERGKRAERGDELRRDDDGGGGDDERSFRCDPRERARPAVHHPRGGGQPEQCAEQWISGQQRLGKADGEEASAREPTLDRPGIGGEQHGRRPHLRADPLRIGEVGEGKAAEPESHCSDSRRVWWDEAAQQPPDGGHSEHLVDPEPDGNARPGRSVDGAHQELAEIERLLHDVRENAASAERAIVPERDVTLPEQLPHGSVVVEHVAKAEDVAADERGPEEHGERHPGRDQQEFAAEGLQPAGRSGGEHGAAIGR